MDISSKTRLLVAVIAILMVLSVFAVYFDSPPQSSTANESNSGTNNIGSTPQVEPYATPQTYIATFYAVNLPTGVQWTVTVDGTTSLSSTSSSITFGLTNGTHTFTVSKPTQYLASPSSGVIFVYGSSVLQYISFSVQEYTLTFKETGLSAGSQWYVNLSGNIVSSVTDSIVYSLSNGSYKYTIGGPELTAADPSSGTAVVYGGNTTIDVAFASTLHKVTFNFAGDISGTSWVLNVAGASYSLNGGSMSLMKENGLYPYTVAPESDHTATPSSGSVLVLNNDAVVNVTLVLTTYQVTFEHKGMIVGTDWSVTMNGVTHTSNTSVITFSVPAGSYEYTINDVSGYSVQNGTGSLSVSTAGQLVSVDFNKNPDIFRSPLLMLAGAAIGIAAGIGIGILIVRNRKK